MSAYESLVIALDDLYRAVITEPDRWDDRALEEWLADTATALEEVPRPVARELRRGSRQARKLARYWEGAAAGGRRVPDDWRGAVDEALGGRGWAPSLEVARHGLAAAPSPELFEEVKARFRVVHFRPWMEGLGYDEWLAQQGRSPARGDEG